MLDTCAFAIFPWCVAFQQKDQECVAVFAYRPDKLSPLIDRLIPAIHSSPMCFGLQVLDRFEFGFFKSGFKVFVTLTPSINCLAINVCFATRGTDVSA